MKYKIAIQSVDSECWADLVADFADYSVYQTIAYQSVRCRKDKAELVCVRVTDDSDQLASAMLMRVIKIPMVGLRVGYIQRGPLIEQREGGYQCTAEMFNAIREYLIPNKIEILRIAPSQFKKADGVQVDAMLQSAGYQMKPRIRPYRTMLLSLDTDEDELLKSFNRGWRRNLKKAEKASLALDQTYASEPFKVLEGMYAVSQARKGFRGISVEEFAETQLKLLPPEKMLVTSVSVAGEPGTVLVTSILGSIADDILVATSDVGRKYGTSYYAYWHAFRACRTKGVMAYDLGGIDPESNPSVHRFKAGTGACDVSSIGTYDAYSSKYVQGLWNALERLKGIAR